MRFLRTASTGRLLALLVGLVVAIAAGSAIAVAASGPGPVPKHRSLAAAVHKALSAPSVSGISARISFTNNLIDASNLQGSDPILQGASGRLWISGQHQMRLELQSSNGDAQVVVGKHSFFISDPGQHVVYEGALPAEKQAGKAHRKAKHEALSSVAQIQSGINKLVRHVNLSGAMPSDVAGQAAYTVRVSPKHDGGLLGSAELAWDAARGVPLRVAVYAKGNSTPVLQLEATDISFGKVPASVFAVSPPSGSKVVKVSTAQVAHRSRHGKAKLKQLTGAEAVQSHLGFKLAAPGKLIGLPRQDVRLLSMGGKRAALITYGQNLGGMAVIEVRKPAHAAATNSQTSEGHNGFSLPTVSIHGVTGQELDTALGTVVTFSRDGVSYTVLGSVPAVAADEAARAL
jgi:outer membrane lipoprotein-sorting protein